MNLKKNAAFIKNVLLYNSILHNKFYSAHSMRKLSYFVSYRKCGRTWVQNTLVNYIGKVKGLIDEPLPFSLNFAKDYPKLKKLDRKITFHHDFYLPGINDKTKPNSFERSPFKFLPTIFLVRDPRDVLISFYHHHIDRALSHENRGKKWKIPSDMNKETFVYHKGLGIKPIIDYFNDLSNFNQNYAQKAVMFKYEDLSNDLKIDSFLNWRAMFSHLLQDKVDEVALEWAIKANTFKKLKTRHENFVKDVENRHPGVKGRIRKGQVGGHVKEFEEKELNFINSYIEQNLDDFYSFYKSQ